MIDDAVVLSVVLKQNALHAFRKAVNVMKDVAVYVTFQTIGSNTLRLSVLDHNACNGIYVDIEVQPHNTPGIWINLVSVHLFKLSSTLSRSRADLALVIHDGQFALFLDAHTHKCVLPNIQFSNFTPLSNLFYGVNEHDYYCFAFVSDDLLNILTCLSIGGTPVVQTTFWGSGKLQFRNVHDMGNTVITKQLVFEHDQVTSENDKLLDQVVLISFVKLLVNLLRNSSVKFCFLLLPKSSTQPLVIKYFVTKETFQYYLMFPFAPMLQHQTGNSPQASIKMNT